jgi:hypothetical protein
MGKHVYKKGKGDEEILCGNPPTANILKPIEK